MTKKAKNVDIKVSYDNDESENFSFPVNESIHFSIIQQNEYENSKYTGAQSFKLEVADSKYKKKIDEENLYLRNLINPIKIKDTELVPDKAYKEVKGEGFRTLFLSAVVRFDIFTSKDEICQSFDEIYENKFVPVLKKLKESGINFIGYLSKPSMMKLAVIDLSQPYCIFEFITVEDDGNLEEKLKALNLTSLLDEGKVSTIEPEINWSTFCY